MLLMNQYCIHILGLVDNFFLTFVADYEFNLEICFVLYDGLM